MAKITDDLRERIIADFKAGNSQNKLARKYELSPATINKICKGLEQSNLEIVNTQIAINTELAQKSEYEVNSIYNAVDEAMKNRILIHNATQRAVTRMSELLLKSDSVADHAMAIKAFDTASLTLKVNERHAPKIDINNTNAQQNNNTLVITRKEIKGSDE